MSDDLSIPSPTYRIPRHRQGMDPGTRRLALIAGGLGGALLVVVGGWSLIGHRSAAVPVVQADSRPIRVKPENPGGMQVAGAERGHPVRRHRDRRTASWRPPPEAPAPQALLRRRPPPSPPRRAVAAGARAGAGSSGAAPHAKPRRSRSQPSRPPRRAEKRPAAPRRRTARWCSSPRCSSEDAAKSEWQRLSKRLPDLLGQRQPAFSKTEHDGHTFWRRAHRRVHRHRAGHRVLRAGARQGRRLLGGRASESRHRRHRRAGAVGRRGRAVPRRAAGRRHPVRAQHPGRRRSLRR